jgi:hypothetical protein
MSSERTPGPKEREMITAGIRAPYICTRCGETLNPERLVWLELDTRTGTYTDDAVEPEHSQGRFMFGAACAKRECAIHRAAIKEFQS